MVWSGHFRFNAAPDDASKKVKGYTEVLPESVFGKGVSIAISFGTYGINFSRDDGEIEIDKFADVNQTPDPNDDVFVFKVKRTNEAFALLYQPLRFIAFGWGIDNGTLTFEQRSASGDIETIRLPYNAQFMSLAIAIGFDPASNKLAPILTLFYKFTFPGTSPDFGGSASGGGLGIFWGW